jgi:superfamily II DNA or RNA helicase
MATFSKFLKSIYQDGRKAEGYNHFIGKEFEVFVKWFLKHDPVWRTQVDKVWLWDEYPDKWGNHKDLGTDLIFKHIDGELWAVQAKCYLPTTGISMSHVDSFISDSNQKSISKRLLITSTNKLGLNAKEKILRQNDDRPVTTYLRTDFERTEVDYPDHYKKLRSGKQKEKPKPHDYQRDAISDVVKEFKTADRGQLIMACGTGKTFTTLWVKEKLKSKNTLVLLPSLNLLAQTLKEWSFASKSLLDIRCVCSDKSVGKKSDDEVIQSTSDAPFPVLGSSDIEKIRKFLKGDGDKVVFSTYQSSDLVAEAQKGRGIVPFDLVVADEAHRCATTGKKDSPFTTILDNKKIKAKKRLFATATPRTYTKAVMTAAEGRGVEVVGMDNEAVFGRRFHTLTFGECIQRTPPLLTDYQVVIIGVNNAMIAEWIQTGELVTTETGDIEANAETLAAQIGLLKAIKDYKLKRVITFHNRVERAKTFAEQIGAAAAAVDKRHLPKGTIHADYVSGAMSTSGRGDKLKRLKNSRPKEVNLLANARCLSEGVDVPSLDGVAFIDPKNSQVDIIQAVGRAIRLSGNKTVGTIVLPVFIKDGEDAEERIEESKFQPVWWVLNALKAHDKVLVDELDTIRTEMGRPDLTKPLPEGLPNKVVIDLHETIGTSFADALQTYLVERTTSSWNFWFGLLEGYVAEFGDALVQANYETPDGYNLGAWTTNQRTNKDDMSKDRKIRLEALDSWVWSKNEFQWEKMFGYLLAYVADKGHALVPGNYKTPGGYNLGAWVISQRTNSDTISIYHRKRLEALEGWVWDFIEFQWEEGFKHLQEYVEDKGNALVPHIHRSANEYNLGRWVQRQRTSKDDMSKDHRKRLDALEGWVWDLLKFQWEQGFKHLLGYVADKGDALVLGNYKSPDGYSLGNWVVTQRTKRDEMTQDRKERLDALDGWVWSRLEYRWEEGFGYLSRYVEDKGNAFVPSRYKAPDGYSLGAWANTQRLRRDDMSKDRRKRLETLAGWVWDLIEFQWEQGFKHLLAYVADKGQALVPGYYKTPGGYNLGRWVQRQRTNKEDMSKDQRKRLEALDGWVWRVRN